MFFFGLVSLTPNYPGISLAVIFFGILLLVSGFLLAQQSMKEKVAEIPQPALQPQPVTLPSQPTVVVPSAAPTKVVAPPETRIALAYLEAPNGRLIVSRPIQEFRRQDFQNIVPASLLDTISQRVPQFTIYMRGGLLYALESDNIRYVFMGLSTIILKLGDVLVMSPCQPMKT